MRDVECGCFPEDETVLKTFTWWTAKLNLRQDYPGKVLLALRRHEEDVLVLKLEEREELWEAARILRAAVGRVLRPNWWNYAFLGNAIPHVHLHLIPRYATSRTIGGWEFQDRHWGAPAARQEEPPAEVFSWLLDNVKEALRA